MDEKGWAKVGGASLMVAPVLYAGISWAGRLGKPYSVDLLLTAIGGVVFVAGAILFYMGRTEG